jgi:hypothetical protein
MKWKSYRRLVRRLGLAIAVAAFAAPAAQAMPVVSAEGGTDAVPQVRYADDLHATVPHVPVLNLMYADDLARPRLASNQPRNTELTDSLGRQLGPPIQPESHVVSASSGLDWSDVGIGVASALGLMLLGVGVLLAGRHNRRSRLATI